MEVNETGSHSRAIQTALELRRIFLDPYRLSGDLKNVMKNELQEKYFVIALRYYLKFNSISEKTFSGIQLEDKTKIDKSEISRIFNDPFRARLKFSQRIEFYEKIVKYIIGIHKLNISNMLEKDEKLIKTNVTFREDEANKRAVARNKEWKKLTIEAYGKIKITKGDFNQKYMIDER